MAAIDKIYGTKYQWIELFEYLRMARPQYVKFMYPPYFGANIQPLSNFPRYADKWLYKNCQLKFVRKAIKDQYRGKP